MSNTTNTTNTTTPVVPSAFVLTAQVPANDLGHQHFQSDSVFARGTGSWQIDDVIGYTHTDG